MSEIVAETYLCDIVFFQKTGIGTEWGRRNDFINATQCCEHGHALIPVHDRHMAQLGRYIVIEHADDKHVSKRFCLFQMTHVTRVQQVSDDIDIYPGGIGWRRRVHQRGSR